jgi:AAA+ superfamily predicted ATPase
VRSALAAQPSESVSEGIAAELAAMRAALAEVCRQVVAREERPDKAEPFKTVAFPPAQRGGALGQLARRADLSESSVAVLRILVTGELDRIAHRFLRRLAEDPTQSGIEVDAVVTAAEGMGVDPLDALEALQPDAPLFTLGLVEWLVKAGPVLTRRCTLPPPVLRFARGRALGDPDDVPLAVRPVLAFADLQVAVNQEHVTAEDAARISSLLLDDSTPAWLLGPAGIGKRSLVTAVAAERARPVLVCDAQKLEGKPLDQVVPRLWREVILRDAVLCVRDSAQPLEGGAHPIAPLYAAICRAGIPAVFTSTDPPRVTELEPPPRLVELGQPPVDARARLWRTALQVDDAHADPAWLAGELPLSPGRIVRAAEQARRMADVRKTPVTRDDVRRAVSMQVSRQVSALGTPVRDSQTWDDVVLPPETLDSIQEMVARVKLRRKVLDDWGFQRKMAKGLGMSALFLGPPGTGKTMVAGLIARDLGLELYQIDLSRLVSKWVGETEKNLAAVFDAADGANVMLLFDECDALFSKRSEVKSSNDRYANAEVNYLLQRLERFEGITILTTNLDSSLDPAFRRRIAFRLTFAVPTVAERETLWRRMLPREAEVDGELDYRQLAAHYELAGGGIRNAVLRAAFLAAAENASIHSRHLERALVLEYRDAGKLTTRGRLS